MNVTHWMSKVGWGLALLGIVALGVPASVAAQSCMLCSAENECVAAPEGTSGHCSCEVHVSEAGKKTCVPRGVCDPNKTKTCVDNRTGAEIAADNADQPRRFAKGLIRHVQNEVDAGGHLDWLLLAAVDLPFGEQVAGTAFSEHLALEDEANGAFGFHVQMTEGRDGELFLFGAVTHTASGHETRYAATLWDGGRRGELEVLPSDAPPETRTWILPTAGER
ncbi:MAG: hypothetical protein AAF772_07760 [Acidobacteriota bacterium]